MSRIVPAGAPSNASRRIFMGDVGKATLSATAVGLLAGCQSMAQDSSSSSESAMMADDVATLNVALGLEHEAINAYQLGAESGLLQPQVVDVAVLFQSQHKEHRDLLASTIAQLGGTPVEPKSMSQYAEDLNATSLSSQGDVLMLAARLEKGATNAYLGVIPAFNDRDLAQAAGRIASDEVMHWTVLNQALGRNLPQQALTFGA